MTKQEWAVEIGGGSHPMNPAALQLNKYPGNGVDIVHDLTVFPYPFKDNELTTVYLSHVLEHLWEPVPVLNELWRIIDPSGFLLVWVPHYRHPKTYNELGHKHYFGDGWANSLEPLAVDRDPDLKPWYVYYSESHSWKDATLKPGRFLRNIELRKFAYSILHWTPQEIKTFLKPLKE